MKPSQQKHRQSIWAAMMIVGTCFAGTCQVRVRDSVVFGTQNFILNTLLNPANFIVTADDIAGNTTP